MFSSWIQPNFRLIACIMLPLWASYRSKKQTLKYDKFDLLTLKFYDEGQMLLWIPDISDILDHGDSF